MSAAMDRYSEGELRAAVASEIRAAQSLDADGKISDVAYPRGARPLAGIALAPT